MLVVAVPIKVFNTVLADLNHEATDTSWPVPQTAHADTD